MATFRLRWRDELVQMLFGLWAVGGLYLDGWAHWHNKPESFFSPWHGVFYSGALLAIAWGTWSQRRGVGFRGGGHNLTVLGLVLFLAGAVGDGVWHSVFGVEADIEALLSPTHLTLMVGGILALTGPFRAAWASDDDGRPSFADFLPTLLSLTLGVAVTSFFWMYVSPFVSAAYAETAPVGTSDVVEMRIIRGIAGVMVATAWFVGPLVLALRRWRTPMGSFTLMYALVAALNSGIDEFWQWPTIAAAALGGLTADVLVARGADLRAIGFLTPAVLWPAYFALFELDTGVGWSVDLWGGVVVMASLAGLMLGVLAKQEAAHGAHPVA